MDYYNTPTPHRAVTADKQIGIAGAVYRGGLLKATSGGIATVDVYDGIDTTGELIDSYTVAASGVDRHPPHDGIIAIRGIYVDLGSNVANFDAYIAPADLQDVATDPTMQPPPMQPY